MMVVAIVLGPGCGGEPGVPRAEHEALLQRLDAMEQRLDALEEPRAGGTAPEERRPRADGDALARPGVLPVVEAAAAAPSPSLSVRVTAGGLELDGKAVTRDDALVRFRDVALTDPHTRLTVLSEPGVPYASVVDLLDLARTAGLTDVAMSARIHGEGDGASSDGALTAGL
jgi:hypothetical protein